MTDPAPAAALPAPEAITTDRLDLTPLRVEHADEMAAVLCDQRLHTFTGGTAPTPPELRARYARLAAGSPDPAVAWCNWVIGLRAGGGRLTGFVQATIAPDQEAPETERDGALAEIAWVVGTAWQGRGIATEAARGLVAWLERQPAVRTVIAHIHPGHHASAAVASAAGLRPTGHLQDGEVRWLKRPRD